MKFSEQWLREWVNPVLSREALTHQITMAGLEVDDVESVATAFSGVIVAEVLDVAPHPDADKLRVCQVSDGQATWQIVCGAANVRTGLKVPMAQIGATLPGDFKIKKAKLRGVESNGMLCSEQELGLADTADGLFELPANAPVGQDIRAYLGLDDAIIDVDLTPNRSDCLSVMGIAREVAALNGMTFKPHEVPEVHFSINDEFPIHLDAPEACPRYVGRVIRNVDLNRPTPLWMVEKLRRSGIRSIDPAVDVTNFVMLELGQPMHAFDLAQLNGAIHVRFARDGETLTLLDGQTVTLDETTLVIADQQKVLAMAGVMGGEFSGVADGTRDLFLESAFFTPLTIVGKARNYGLHTDSSHRFERGVDSDHQRRAIERATRLLIDIVGGQPGPVVEMVSKPHLPVRDEIELRHQRVDDVLGIHLDRTRIEEILARLGVTVTRVTKEGGVFKVPSHRFDLSIEVDLIEEIGRIYGYNKLPVTEPKARLAIPSLPEDRLSVRALKQQLVGQGFREVVTYSFVDRESLRLLTPMHSTIELANPIASDMAVMRTTLIAGLIKAAGYNQNRQQTRLRLFETGLAFHSWQGEIVQEPKLAGLLAGGRLSEGWLSSKEKVDFFDLKGQVEALLALTGKRYQWRKGDHPALHPGQSAEILLDGAVVGIAGALHPQIVKSLDLNGPTFTFELCLNSIVKAKVPNFRGISKFPEIRRDLAIIIDKATDYADVSAVIAESAGESCVRHNLFDVYLGENLGADKKSLAVSIVWRNSERTLRDEEVTEAFNHVIKALEGRFGASLRS
ncbi:MAG: phenylalanine--tRNA ligase subunit beta [Hahellaceae bacterium]|nr:phenylalanine--tRNA ligase subunit beta [Hahellaceae bacterium]